MSAKLTTLTGKIQERFDSLGVTYEGTSNGSAGLITSEAGKINVPELYFYHPDHLGSSSLITDNIGALVQHIQYVPFGEVFVEERASASSWRTPYLFNAKELDDETGLYYYGARYYDPRTSVWLSVDPLAEKKLWMSSYVYCSNNPVMKIDPDGRSDIEIDKQNKTIKCTENTKSDNIYVINEKGEKTLINSFKVGTVSLEVKEDIKVTNSDNITESKDLYLLKVKGDKNAKRLFESLADPINTKVEWTHAKVGNENSNSNIVGTSFDASSTPVGHFLRETKYTLKEVTHNHPSGNYNTSRSDKDGYLKYLQSNPHIKTYIYTHCGNYSEYDNQGTFGFRSKNTEVEIIGSKNK